mmetsp:Transcript_44054/g.81905  ORF Transcript_44054/g.81905 Transcript_44054/m.81905 type:complete len:159 (+) Transcript_44054:111-587(+)
MWWCHLPRPGPCADCEKDQSILAANGEGRREFVGDIFRVCGVTACPVGTGDAKRTAEPPCITCTLSPPDRYGAGDAEPVRTCCADTTALIGRCGAVAGAEICILSACPVKANGAAVKLPALLFTDGVATGCWCPICAQRAVSSEGRCIRSPVVSTVAT